MKLVMTLMVRDEADIVSAMLDHHIEQGVDQFIVTDNGSIDGTTDILRGYEARGIVELRHDPEHNKQQSRVVSAMASDAYTLYGADWVLNADADEFFVPVDRSLTLHEVFERIPKEYQAFQVPVINLTGPPAQSGSGLQRLVYRDRRPVTMLRTIGLRAHATPDAVHVGREGVQVVQGNHEVDMESKGSPEPGLAIEVLHLPWRSWKQYVNKVEVSGRAYENSPLTPPSPNHHGMRDYARLKAGTLLPFYIRRHPSDAELEAGLADGTYVREDLLANTRVSPVADVPFDEATLADITPTLKALEDAQNFFRIQVEQDAAQREIEIVAERERSRRELEGQLSDARRPLEHRIGELDRSLDSALTHVEWLEARLASLENSVEVRYGKKLRKIIHRG